MKLQENSTIQYIINRKNMIFSSYFNTSYSVWFLILLYKLNLYKEGSVFNWVNLGNIDRINN